MLGLIAILVFVALAATVYFLGVALFRKQPKALLKAGIAALLGIVILPVIGGSFLPGEDLPVQEGAKQEAPAAQSEQPLPPTEDEPPQPEEEGPVDDVVTQEKTVAEKLIELGNSPDQNVIEKNVEDGRHSYSWERPDIGETVQGVWYSKNDWWIRVRQPKFSREEIDSSMERNKSNGVADSYVIKTGPLEGGYFVESATQTNIYSDSPRWHQMHEY